jgi:type III restriction enzyme
MAGFNFEKNLEHQDSAVKSAVGIFDGVEIAKPEGTEKGFVNSVFDTSANYKYVNNIGRTQERNSIERKVRGRSKIIDVMMETGTGKTYTYTKTIFELNKLYGIFKFVIVVPTLPIKAGTIDFLNSDSAREHFKEQYGKTIKLHIVESKNGSKNKKSQMPPAVNSFVNAGVFEKDKIQALVINAGMVNSKTMQEKFDRSLFDKYNIPFQAISSVKPFMIIDEPHKFDQSSKTWENIQKMTPQFIIRYGATFKENENLIYSLSAVDSFNRNLVKGVIGHITEFETGKNTAVKFVSSNGKEAGFHLMENNGVKTFKIAKTESLEKIHPAMSGLMIENLNKTALILSNGLELKKGDKINPYAYAETLQESMIKKAIQHHFIKERELLNRDVKIKPLTLFFIDNIEEYRNKGGYIKTTVEKYIKAEVEKLLKTEAGGFYKNYLEKTLEDISQTHGGYFAVDKKETDEVIEKEVNEILHDKQAMLSLENTRRFIFSKWTLREGWDNPNIFQICKLRSSGSEISKLQEVGRGLRLPVNQYGHRVKDEQFYLNYFVDFTENDFVEKLVNEINEKSGAISREDTPKKLTEAMIRQIVLKYNVEEEELLEQLDGLNIIKRNNEFKENGFEHIKSQYPLIFEGIFSNKIRKASDAKKNLKIRVEKYSQLKDLWEKLNQKVILEYKIENENMFKEIFTDFLKTANFSLDEAQEKIAQMEIENNRAVVKEEAAIYGNEIKPILTMGYNEFLKQLSQNLNINIKTIHSSFIGTQKEININRYLNQSALRIIKQKFDNYLMQKALNKFGIEYQKVTSAVHPTKFTSQNGEVKKEVSASDIGIFYSEQKTADNYFFDELFYDSELEKDNIQTKISDVVVFTKIPKNSIKIPVAGGKSYSPDFAYVLHYKDGKKKLYFIVETKNADEDSLRKEEEQKIKHAEKFFGDDIKVEFRKQFNSQKIAILIQEVYG